MKKNRQALKTLMKSRIDYLQIEIINIIINLQIKAEITIKLLLGIVLQEKAIKDQLTSRQLASQIKPTVAREK